MLKCRYSVNVEKQPLKGHSWNLSQEIFNSGQDDFRIEILLIFLRCNSNDILGYLVSFSALVTCYGYILTRVRRVWFLSCFFLAQHSELTCFFSHELKCIVCSKNIQNHWWCYAEKNPKFSCLFPWF